MRDPNRIYKFCNQLATVWATEASDMRFGQFVEQIFSKIRDVYKKDPFYLEEDEMMAYIERILGYWP